MLKALVLVCSVAITPDLRTCDQNNAVDVVLVPEEFGSPAMCFMHGQAYLAQTELGRQLTTDEVRLREILNLFLHAMRRQGLTALLLQEMVERAGDGIPFEEYAVDVRHAHTRDDGQRYWNAGFCLPRLSKQQRQRAQYRPS